MASTNALTRAVAKAAEALGGEQQLAERLEVSLAELKAWTSGSVPPPPNVFIRIADLVQRETRKAYRDGAEPAPVIFRARKPRLRP